MPDKKLTDSEIVKALECCANDKGCKENKCPFFETVCTEFSQPIEKYTLDLINRLQCERNKYRRKAQNQRDEINHLQVEKKHYLCKEKCLSETIKNYQEALEQAKTENDVMIHYIDHLKAENERSKDYIATLEKEVDWYRDELRHSDKKVANKAYKEVFEKINEKAEVRKIKIFGGLHILKVVLLHDINELKHEMVGEDNGKM